MNCLSCSSSDVKKNGKKVLSNGIVKQRYLCNDCGKHTSIIINTAPLITDAMSTHSALPSHAVATVYAAGRGTSLCFVIPHFLAKKHTISAGDKVAVTEGDGGILIKKLEAGA